MNYYKDSIGNVFAYDDEQVSAGLAGDKTAMTAEEVEAHLATDDQTTLPYDPDTELANPTVSEWNALCEAAGAPELQK